MSVETKIRDNLSEPNYVESKNLIVYLPWKYPSNWYPLVCNVGFVYNDPEPPPQL